MKGKVREIHNGSVEISAFSNLYVEIAVNFMKMFNQMLLKKDSVRERIQMKEMCRNEHGKAVSGELVEILMSSSVISRHF
jgi:hypothetical protein